MSEEIKPVVGVNDEAYVAQAGEKLLLIFRHQSCHEIFAINVANPHTVGGGVEDKVKKRFILF